MAKINLLTSEVFNRIAAGEVVERPKSVVKELVENSIDAGANNISIEVQDGGITSIKITDDGSGIEKDYVETAFLPHATSKVQTYEDLESIDTLGFRGEALASIASVSQVELTTRYVQENVGTQIELRGGEKIKYNPIDRNSGTTITVRNIFFNTPARQKFLKKAKSEEADITNVVQRLIVANPDISFRYFADSKMIYSSSGKGLESAVYSIFPTSITKNLIYLDEEYSGIRVSGYISTPELTKANRSYQTTILNGRVIKNDTIEIAVMRAYGEALMKRAFPVFVLNVIMPFDSMDINVTPSKTDVRFVDEKLVFSAVYRAVNSALANNQRIFNAILAEKDKEEKVQPQVAIKSTMPPNNYENKANVEQFSEQNKQNTINQANKQDVDYVKLAKANELKVNIEREAYDNHKQDKINVLEQSTDPKKSELINTINDIMNTKANHSPVDIPSPSAILKVNDVGYAVRVDKPNPSVLQSSLFDEIEKGLSVDKPTKTLGQIFNTYVLVAKGDNLYIIDQHAAHERMLYDKLVSQLDNNTLVSQPLLTPQIMQLSASESVYIADFITEFSKIGLDIEQFGDCTFKVNSIPALFDKFDANKFFDYVLADKNKYGQFKLAELMHEKLAMTACKAAIKGGMPLSDMQIAGLIKDMEQNKPVQCPHGRPTIIKLSKGEIDKMFKRVL